MQIQINDLPGNWQTVATFSALQRIGSNWVIIEQTFILKVPSAVIPYEYNYVINTAHPEFSSKVHLVRTEAYFWNSRLVLPINLSDYIHEIILQSRHRQPQRLSSAC